MESFRRRFVVDLTVALIIVAALVGGLVFFGSNIVLYGEQITVGRGELAARAATSMRLLALRSEYAAKGEAYLKTLRGTIPVADQLIDLKRDFQALASRHGLDYSFSFIGDTPPSGETLGVAKFRITVGGSFDKLVRFLEELQRFRYLQTLESFTVNRRDARMEMTVDGKALYRPQ